MWFFNQATRKEAPKSQEQKRLLSYQPANMQGSGTRREQEDSFAFVNATDVTEIKRNGLLALVADGMGGMEDGRAVSSAAAGMITDDFRKMDRSQNPGIQLKESIFRADRALYDRFAGNGGTTLVACIFFQENMYFASVGDSYLYLKRGDGIYRLNREQTCRQEAYLALLKSGSLDTAQADADKDGARLSQFLGSGWLDDVDALCRPWRLFEGDVLLLCSDGVGNVLTEQTLLSCLSEPSASQCCRRIEKEIHKQARPDQDNYTALVIFCRY